LIDGNRLKIVISPLPRKVLNPLNCLGAVLGSLDDDIKTAADLFWIIGALNQLGPSEYAGKRVIEIVGHARRKFTQG